jgi:hypothetical protein
MKNTFYLLIFSVVFLFQSCSVLPDSAQYGLKFSTEKSTLPDSLVWRKIGFAKELINQKEMIVVIGGGRNPIPMDKWDDFKPRFPYKKNIDRNLLFQQTAFYRSPNISADCKGDDCITQRDYMGYTWVELAQPVCVDFIPDKTDMLKPEKGHLVIKTIKKCQATLFTDSIYQLTDNKGNFYVMHAYESEKPDTTAILPSGWSLKKVMLQEPLIVSPFGGGDCYYNIVGDHLGQGYHQYIFADKVYPAEK